MHSKEGEQCNDAGRNKLENISDKIRYNQMYSASVLATHPKRLMCVTTYQRGTNTQNSGLSVALQSGNWSALFTTALSQFRKAADVL